MARIAYSLAGDGGGHASRNSVIINKLLEKGHKVDVFTSHRSFEELSSKYKGARGVKVHKVPGLRFEYNKDKGKVSFGETIKANFKPVLAFPFTSFVLRKKAKQGKYDMFISDFDILFSLATAPLARSHKIPRIRINHHAIFQAGKFDVDKGTKQRIRLIKFWLDLFNPKADVVLINSFYMPDGLKDPRIKFVGPVLKEDIYNLKPSNQGHVLVYLKPAIEKVLYPHLLKMTDYDFIVYAKDPAELKPLPHIRLKQFSPSFLNDLATCSCVIGTAGIELPSEAAYFEKPMLAIPEKDQIEQEVNGFFIQKEGMGKTLPNDKVSVREIKNFLKSQEKYRQSIRKFKAERFKIGTEEVLKEIAKVLKSDSKAGKARERK